MGTKICPLSLWCISTLILSSQTTANIHVRSSSIWREQCGFEIMAWDNEPLIGQVLFITSLLYVMMNMNLHTEIFDRTRHHRYRCLYSLYHYTLNIIDLILHVNTHIIVLLALFHILSNFRFKNTMMEL